MLLELHSRVYRQQLCREAHTRRDDLLDDGGAVGGELLLKPCLHNAWQGREANGELEAEDTGGVAARHGGCEDAQEKVVKDLGAIVHGGLHVEEGHGVGFALYGVLL